MIMKCKRILQKILDKHDAVYYPSYNCGYSEGYNGTQER
jgi:hypothetical protein